jgi:hypothetical protein
MYKIYSLFYFAFITCEYFYLDTENLVCRDRNIHLYLHANEYQKGDLIMTDVLAVYQKLGIRETVSQMINKLVVITLLMHAKTGD